MSIGWEKVKKEAIVQAVERGLMVDGIEAAEGDGLSLVSLGLEGLVWDLAQPGIWPDLGCAPNSLLLSLTPSTLYLYSRPI